MKLGVKKFWHIIKTAVKEWLDDDPFREGAIICYYAILSLPGLLIIIVWSLGHFYGQDAVSGQISNQIGGVLGQDQAAYIQNLISNAYLDADAMWYMQIIGVFALIFGATTLFFQFQKSLNNIWHVTADAGKGLKRLIVNRANSMGLILVIAFLMLISLVLSSVVATFQDTLTRLIGGNWKFAIQMLNVVIGFGVITVLFALMFKILPDVEFSWKAVWIGAIFTALLFNLGKQGLSLYFSISEPGSGYGAAGTVILVMLWVNYTTLIVLLGATFTQVYAREMGYTIRPSKYAQWSTDYIVKHKDNLFPELMDERKKLLSELSKSIAKASYVNPDDKKLSVDRFLPKQEKTSS